MCDPHYDIYFRLLDKIDPETADNQSNCSSETLRQRKVFVEDEKNMLNTGMFIPNDLEDMELELVLEFEVNMMMITIKKQY